MIRCHSDDRVWNHNRALIALGKESVERVSLVGHDLTPCPRASARRWKRQFQLQHEYSDGSEHHRGTSPSPFSLSALSIPSVRACAILFNIKEITKILHANINGFSTHQLCTFSLACAPILQINFLRLWAAWCGGSETCPWGSEDAPREFSTRSG